MVHGLGHQSHKLSVPGCRRLYLRPFVIRAAERGDHRTADADGGAGVAGGRLRNTFHDHDGDHGFSIDVDRCWSKRPEPDAAMVRARHTSTIHRPKYLDGHNQFNQPLYFVNGFCQPEFLPRRAQSLESPRILALFRQTELPSDEAAGDQLAQRAERGRGVASTKSIFRNRMVYLICPGVDAAFDALEVFETLLAQKF